MSMDARVSLIKSTLGHLPQYYISLFKMPVAVCKKIEKMQRHFLWGDSIEKISCIWLVGTELQKAEIVVDWESKN